MIGLWMNWRTQHLEITDLPDNGMKQWCRFKKIKRRFRNVWLKHSILTFLSRFKTHKWHEMDVPDYVGKWIGPQVQRKWRFSPLCQTTRLIGDDDRIKPRVSSILNKSINLRRSQSWNWLRVGARHNYPTALSIMLRGDQLSTDKSFFCWGGIYLYWICKCLWTNAKNRQGKPEIINSSRSFPFNEGEDVHVVR